MKTIRVPSTLALTKKGPQYGLGPHSLLTMRLINSTLTKPAESYQCKRPKPLCHRQLTGPYGGGGGRCGPEHLLLNGRCGLHWRWFRRSDMQQEAAPGRACSRCPRQPEISTSCCARLPSTAAGRADQLLCLTVDWSALRYGKWRETFRNFRNALRLYLLGSTPTGTSQCHLSPAI